MHAIFSEFCLMYFSASTFFKTGTSLIQLKTLQQRLLNYSFFNFFLVSALGLLMRGVPLLNSFPLPFKNLLHAHSHFAFGGWVMPVLIWMIIQYFPSIAPKVGATHWRNIIFLVLFSAYGMLASFPFEGYALVSILFSTLSVLAGFYLATVLWKASNDEKQKTSVRFLRAGLVYLVLSSIGPFATGPLIAMGMQGNPVYFNAIYFYLHFQYNGWFTFAVLAVLYTMLEKNAIAENGRKVFMLFNISCLPAFFLSTLWNHPNGIFYIAGASAGLLQLAGTFYLIKDYRLLKIKNSFVKNILVIAIIAFAMKNILQSLSAVPFIAEMAYNSRNFIIAYLHLVLLGFISLFAIAAVLNANKDLVNTSFKMFFSIFLISFIVTEALLAVQATGIVYNFYLPSFSLIIFYASCLFPIAIFCMYWKTHFCYKKLKKITAKL
ncbi:MAG TPA: hypothetical protein VIQ00_12865 [Chitinophagaceae bacterium]